MAGERQSFARRLLATPRRVLSAARQHPLLVAVLACGTLIIVGSGVSIWYYLRTRGPQSDRYISIEMALAQLDAGQFEEADRTARLLQAKTQGDYLREGYPLFVRGAVLAHEAAQQHSAAQRRTYYLLAARYLEQSRDFGFPPGRRREGHYLLATALFRSGCYAESLPVLLKVREAEPERRFELARLLSTAYLRDTQPQLQKALQYNRQWLDAPVFRAGERDEALVQQAEIALLLEDNRLCRNALADIAEDSPVHDAALLLEARLLLWEGDQLTAGKGSPEDVSETAEQKYRRAIVTLERAQSKDATGTVTRQSRYLLGLCHLRLGDRKAATESLRAAQRMDCRTPEALVAGLLEAELEQQRGRSDDALKLYLKVLENAGPPDTYRNPWLTLNELQSRLLAAQRLLLREQKYQSALELIDALAPIVPDDLIAQSRSESHEAWANSLMSSAGAAAPATAADLRKEAREQYRLAGVGYRQLARLRYATSEYPFDLWKSGHCFLLGQNYELAARLLREHLEHVPRKQAPPGLASLGECYLALQHYRSALGTLDECLQNFPAHPESYRARLLASMACRELGMLDRAQSLLIDNLHNSSLTPRSMYWQDSLFAYGELLYREARMRDRESQELASAEANSPERQQAWQLRQTAHDLYQQAINSLGEAVARQPDAQQAGEARYYLAESYRLSANLPRAALAEVTGETRRAALREQLLDALQQAADLHHSLRDDLTRKRSEVPLSDVEQRILRNACFACADALFDLGKYDEAINAYADATNRYQHEPEALEALTQMASCYRLTGAEAEARGTYLQAQSVLSRLARDADYTRTTRYSREQWETLLNWLAQL